MKHFLLLVLFFSSTAPTFAQSQNPHVENEIIVHFSDESSQEDRQQVIDEMGTLLQGRSIQSNGNVIIEQLVLVLVYAYPVMVGGEVYSTEIELISTMHGHLAEVDNTGLNYMITTVQHSFDTFMGNNGLSAYSPVSASCETAYPGGPLEGQIGSPPPGALIKVGVLDTGLDPYYTTINKYVAGEVNVLTDDNDPETGIVISYGYNSAEPLAPDNNGHGTAVAGIIAGLSDRADLATKNLELYIIKCFDDNGNATMYNLIQAVHTVNTLGLDILNLSWSYLSTPEDQQASILEEELRSLSNQDNVIIVAGSGNDAADLAIDAYAPAALQNISNLITVGGVVGEEGLCNGDLASFSNYGDAVEIAAPAASMSVPGLNGYWTLNASGTSFATPIVAAAVVQSWIANYDQVSTNPSGGTHPAVQQVLQTATPVPNLDAHGIEGVVNFEAACFNPTTVFFQEANLETNIFNTSLSSIQAKEEPVSIFNVAPNPFIDQLSVSFDNISQTSLSLEVLNLQGVKIAALVLDAPTGKTTGISIPADLPAGPYLIQLRQDDNLFTKMIIKE